MSGRKKSSRRNSGGRVEKTRVRSARGRRLSSTLWLQRQLNDPYVQAAEREGFRSRSAYKLIELDEKFGLLRPGLKVVASFKTLSVAFHHSVAYLTKVAPAKWMGSLALAVMAQVSSRDLFGPPMPRAAAPQCRSLLTPIGLTPATSAPKPIEGTRPVKKILPLEVALPLSRWIRRRLLGAIRQRPPRTRRRRRIRGPRLPAL